MKKFFKYIFLIVLLVIFAMDIAGLWQYKLKKSDTSTTSSEVSSEAEEDLYLQVEETQDEDVQLDQIEYTELTYQDFADNEKLFIINVVNQGDETFVVQGCIFEQFEITKQEYTNLKSSSNEYIEIFGIDYNYSTMNSGNLILESSDENAESFYIKYDSSQKKYLLVNSTTDYIVYRSTENYVQMTVSGDLAFVIEKNSQTTKKTVQDIEGDYQNVQFPQNTSKINLCELTFNKSGICTKITELDM